MANGDFFDTFLRNASNYNGGEPEYYEDTHDANGNYIGSGAASARQQPQYGAPPQYAAPQQFQTAAERTEYTLANQPKFTQLAGNVVPPSQQQVGAVPLPTTKDLISPQIYRNFVIYHPRTTADVEQLIAYLRRREPALVDLDPISDSPDAQRLMDFTSGAAYALGDTVITVRRNLFLIMPENVDVLKPEDNK